MSSMRDEKIPALKLAVVQYIIVAVLAVLITGLWRLQILGASNYRELAEANRIRKVPILAPRVANLRRRVLRPTRRPRRYRRSQA